MLSDMSPVGQQQRSLARSWARIHQPRNASQGLTGPGRTKWFHQSHTNGRCIYRCYCELLLTLTLNWQDQPKMWLYLGPPRRSGIASKVFALHSGPIHTWWTQFSLFVAAKGRTTWCVHRAGNIVNILIVMQSLHRLTLQLWHTWRKYNSGRDFTMVLIA